MSKKMKLVGHSQSHDVVKLSDTEFSVPDGFSRIIYREDSEDPDNWIAVDFDGGPFIMKDYECALGKVTGFKRPDIIVVEATNKSE